MDFVWQSYLRTFQTTRVSDQTLASAIIEAVFIFNDEVLHQLITTVRSGRRVFKQLCSKGDIPFSVFVKLEARGEKDLAFFVVFSHSMWPFVLQLYENPNVRARSRELAFQKALRQGAWEVVTQMVTSSVSSVAQGRVAFQEAMRQERVDVAQQLCEKGLRVPSEERVLALKACQRLRLWEAGVYFLKTLSEMELHVHRNLITSFVEESCKDGKLTCFLNITEARCWLLRDRDFLRKLFRNAFQRGRTDFVLEFCRNCDTLNGPSQYAALRVATALAIGNKELGLLEQLSILEPFRLSESQTLVTMKKTMKRNNTWNTWAPILENSLTRNSRTIDVESLFEELFGTYYTIISTQCSPQAEWCFRKSYYHLAFLLSLRSSHWNLTRDILHTFGKDIGEEFLSHGFSVVYDENAMDTAVLLLKFLPVTWSFLLCRFMHNVNATASLIQKCKENGMTKWVVTIAIKACDWKKVKEEIKTCHDRSVLDYTISEAASQHRWNVVQSLMHRCSQTAAALAQPLTTAVQCGELEPAKALIRRIDPYSAKDSRNQSLLLLAINSYSNREEMVKLCIKAGLSTHEALRNRGRSAPYWYLYSYPSTAMKTALQNGQMPLVKLLHASGATSNAELFSQKNNQIIINQLNFQGRTDIVQYLDQAASTPRSLKDLSRFVISHLIGCQPGRKRRVESLPLPCLAKEFIRFKDILNPQE